MNPNRTLLQRHNTTHSTELVTRDYYIKDHGNVDIRYLCVLRQIDHDQYRTVVRGLFIYEQDVMSECATEYRNNMFNK